MKSWKRDVFLLLLATLGALSGTLFIYLLRNHRVDPFAWIVACIIAWYIKRDSWRQL